MTSPFPSRWSMMPGRRSVTFREQTSPGAYREATVADVWHRPMTLREAEASNGVYTLSDRSYFIPKVKLDRDPKPGDKVVEGTDSWTVQDVSEAGALDVWKLTARNLTVVFQLRDRIDIEEPVGGVDASGASLKDLWRKKYSQLVARVQPVAADTADVYGERGFRVSHRVFIAEEIVIAEQDRIKMGSRYFDVRGYEGPERIDQLPVILAELMP